MEVGGQRHAPAVLPPGKTRYPLYRRVSGLQGRSERVRKNLAPPTGIRPPDRPALSESLCRLSYRGPPQINAEFYLNLSVLSLRHCGSKSFRPDQLFKVTNKTTLFFFNIYIYICYFSIYINLLFFNIYINLPFFNIYICYFSIYI